MQVPPVQFDLSAEKVDPPLPRLSWVWILVSLFFASIVFASLFVNDKKSSVIEDPVKNELKILEMQLCMKSLSVSSGNDQKGKMFEDQVEGLLQKAKTESSAQKLRIVLRVEDKSPPFKDDMANLAKSVKVEDQAFARLYTEPKPNKAEATALLKQIDGSEIAEKIAIVQVNESFGDKAIRSKTFDPARVAGIGFMLMGIVVGLGLGFIAWYVYWFRRQNGKLAPKGLPLGNIDAGRADRLVFVAFVVIATYLVTSLAIGLIVKKPFFGLEILSFVPVFIAIAICINVPIFGWRITPKAIGLTFERFPEKLGWAVAAFFANIPITLTMLALAPVLQKLLPGGSHPVGDELLKNPTPMKVATIIFLACVIAPIWEEIVFRGMIFPAIAKVLNKPIYGALISSLIFAGIHPQGLFGIPALMAIAMFLCGVSYQTKSLMSNIMVHSMYNGALVVSTFVAAPLFK